MALFLTTLKSTCICIRGRMGYEDGQKSCVIWMVDGTNKTLRNSVLYEFKMPKHCILKQAMAQDILATASSFLLKLPSYLVQQCGPCK